MQTTPGEKICTKLQYSRTFTCCDKTDLDVGTQLLIPPEDYTFGIVTASSAVRPLAFASSVTEFHVEHFLARPAGETGPLPGSIFTLQKSDQQEDSILLLRFFIGN